MKRLALLSFIFLLVACGGSSNSTDTASTSGPDSTSTKSEGTFSSAVFNVWRMQTLNDKLVDDQSFFMSVEEAPYLPDYAGIITLWFSAGTPWCYEIYYVTTDIDISAGGATGTLEGTYAGGGGQCALADQSARSKASSLDLVTGSINLNKAGTQLTVTLAAPWKREVVAIPDIDDWLIMRVIGEEGIGQASVYESDFVSEVSGMFTTTENLPWQKMVRVTISDPFYPDSYYVSASATDSSPTDATFIAASTLNGKSVGYEVGENPSTIYRVDIP
jgi:hypothetical protein